MSATKASSLLTALRPRDGKLRALLVLGAAVAAVIAVDRGRIAASSPGDRPVELDAAEIGSLESHHEGGLARIRGAFDSDTMIRYGFGGDIVAVQLQGTRGRMIVLTSPDHHPVLANPALWGAKLGILGILEKTAAEERARRGEAEPEPPPIDGATLAYLEGPHTFAGVLVRPAGGLRLQKEGTVRYRDDDIEIVERWGSYCRTEGISCESTPWVLLEGEAPANRAVAATLALLAAVAALLALMLGFGKPAPRPGFAGALEALRSPLHVTRTSTDDAVAVDATLKLNEGLDATAVTVRGSYRRAPDGRHGSVEVRCGDQAVTLLLQGPIVRTSIGDAPLVEMRTGHPEIVAATGRIVGTWPRTNGEWSRVMLETLTFDVRTATQGIDAAMLRGPIDRLAAHQAATLMALCVESALD